jgi:hypothetical protein
MLIVERLAAGWTVAGGIVAKRLGGGYRSSKAVGWFDHLRNVGAIHDQSATLAVSLQFDRFV